MTGMAHLTLTFSMLNGLFHSQSANTDIGRQRDNHCSGWTVVLCVFACVTMGSTVTKIFQRGGETVAEGFSTATLEDFNIIFYFTVCKGYVHSNYGDLSQLEETSPLCSLASSKKLR